MSFFFTPLHIPFVVIVIAVAGIIVFGTVKAGLDGVRFLVRTIDPRTNAPAPKKPVYVQKGDTFTVEGVEWTFNGVEWVDHRPPPA